MPNIEPSQALCDLFINGLTKEYSENRVEVHVSDLVYCLKLSLFARTIPKPVDEVTLGYFVDGANRHQSLQSLSGLKREVHLEKYGVVGSLDLLGIDGEPIEIKSTRALKGISAHYLRQLGYYCCLAGTNIGHLVIQRILNKEKPWEWFRIVFTQEEMQQLDFELQRDSKLLQDSINRYANIKPEWYPSIDLEELQATLKANAILCAASLPRTRYGWKCSGCRYRYECKTPLSDEQTLINERIQVFVKQLKEEK